MEPMIKGYIIQNVGAYISGDPLLSKRVPSSILQQIEKSKTAFKSTDWRPREEAMTLFQALVDIHKQDGQPAVKAALQKAGAAVSEVATATWLKLLMKILTPRMFAKKFPEMFARDHNFGGVEILKVDEKGMEARVSGVGGYSYLGPFSLGWGEFGLKAIGMTLNEVTVTPWSLEEPGPDVFTVKFTWL